MALQDQGYRPPACWVGISIMSGGNITTVKGGGVIFIIKYSGGL